MSGADKSRDIANVCLETDLYLLDGDTEEERQALEKLCREFFEDGYDAIYRILTDDKRDFITMGERYDIISFVVSMFYRNNSWVVGYNTLMNETIAKAYTLAKENGKDSLFWSHFRSQEFNRIQIRHFYRITLLIQDHDVIGL